MFCGIAWPLLKNPASSLFSPLLSRFAFGEGRTRPEISRRVGGGRSRIRNSEEAANETNGECEVKSRKKKIPSAERWEGGKPTCV